MFLPFLTQRSESNKKLYRRRAGGRGGGGGRSGSSSGSGGKSSGGNTKSVPLSTKTPGGKGSATAYGSGGGKVTTIPSGSLFAGRTTGGGTRGNVFGTRSYGSGYPGVTGRGVGGRGFPFYFWPVVWVGGGGGSGAYLYDKEYGDPNNSSRPGGQMVQANFISNTSSTTFHLLADNSTVTSLISSIAANCSSSHLSSSSSTSAIPLNTSDPNSPKPEQAIQYYRASSVVLTLDGYNNTAAFSDDANAVDTPLPAGIDTTLLSCLNETIGLAVPLVDGVGARWSTGPGAAAISLFWVVWFLLGNMI